MLAPELVFHRLVNARVPYAVNDAELEAHNPGPSEDLGNEAVSSTQSISAAGCAGQAQV